MALRDQPYIPLYVQDFETDEKLIYCSALATGVYIRIMCHMHKSEQYGKILLKQNFKQTSKQVKNFALQLAKILPYELDIIEQALSELISEKVLILDGDILIQKRMVRDNEISELRSKSGYKGGRKTQQKLASKFAKAKTQANSENANENKDIESKDKGGVGEKEKGEKEKSFDRFNEWVDKSIPYLRRIKNQITFEEYCRLSEKYNGDQIKKILTDLSNYKDASKKYVSVNLTFQNWAKKEYG